MSNVAIDAFDELLGAETKLMDVIETLTEVQDIIADVVLDDAEEG